MRKYERDLPNTVSKNSIPNKKLKTELINQEKKYSYAVKAAAQSEILLSEDVGFLEAEGLEKTYQFNQDKLRSVVDINTTKKMFELKLNLGPYNTCYTKNGQFYALGGKKGHIAIINSNYNKIITEFQTKELIHDLVFLQDYSLLAVAQKKKIFVYDNTGLEVHCLRYQYNPQFLEYLPYHFLLASSNDMYHLTYQDISTGEFISDFNTKCGECKCMKQNPYNAIIHMGHASGTVSLWCPSTGKPLVKMFCHKGGVTGLTVDRTGKYMITAGGDSLMKIWDIRNFKVLNILKMNRPCTDIDISQTGLIAATYNSTVEIYRDSEILLNKTNKRTLPYMTHRVEGSSSIVDLHFRPYEDSMLIGHNNGISSIIVPGSGEANFDTFENNPYQNQDQRREDTVHKLLEKIPADMICLDPTMIGKVRNEDEEVEEDEEDEEKSKGIIDKSKNKKKKGPRPKYK